MAQGGEGMKTFKCDRCHRRFRERAADASMWNVIFEDGRPVCLVCPDCQTDAESLEARVNEAMIDYEHKIVTPDGRYWAPFRKGGVQ